MKTIKSLIAAIAVFVTITGCGVSQEVSGGNKNDISKYSDIYEYLSTIPSLVVEGTNVFVRGVSSLSGSSFPLILVDGVENSNISGIPISQISDVTVLKSAAECAPYGLRGGAGVILISLKKQ